MSKTKSPLLYLKEDQRNAAIEQIIRFFQNEREEQIGVIAAEAELELSLKR